MTTLTDWVKLSLLYIGSSKKHEIFRAKKWNRSFEKIIKKPVFDVKYRELGKIKDIFGPVDLPFISIKTGSSQEFEKNSYLYVKLSK